MVFKFFLSCYFVVVASLACTATPLKVGVSAEGGILINARTGAVLWQKNAHQSYFPASVTKILTAIYAVEKQGERLDEMITASSDALCIVPSHVRRGGGHPPYRLEVGGTHMAIKPGETLSFRHLIYGLMLCSGNDSANVLAEHISGNIETFVREMNGYARQMGCKNTTFNAPHGLHHPEHKTTAFDMALLGRRLLENPFLREVVKMTQAVRPATNKQPQSIMRQFNLLLKPGKFFYPKAIGVKTGHTAAAGFNLVAAAEDSNRELIAVVLGCKTNEERYQDVIALFDAGFHESRVSRTLFSKGFDLLSCTVQGGKTPLQAYLSEDVTLSYYPSEEPEYKTAIVWNLPPLPIRASQKVGEIHVLNAAGEHLISAPLLATKEVRPTLAYKMRGGWILCKQYINPAWVIGAGGMLLLLALFCYSKRQKAEQTD